MTAISDKLNYINDTKLLIKEALVNKGISISETDTFRSYVDKISEIKGDSVVTKLPDYLTEVEYIQRTSGGHEAAIQIPIFFSNKITLETKFRLLAYSTTSTSYAKHVFGCYGSSNVNVSALYVSTSTNPVVWSWGQYGVNRRYSQLGTANTTTDFTVKFSVDKVISNGEEKEILYTHSNDPLPNDWQADRVLSLFGTPWHDINHIAYSRIYYMKIYDGDVLKYDLIPVLNTKTSTYGLFDKVVGGYYENSEHATLYTGGTIVQNADD